MEALPRLKINDIIRYLPSILEEDGVQNEVVEKLVERLLVDEDSTTDVERLLRTLGASLTPSLTTTQSLVDLLASYPHPEVLIPSLATLVGRSESEQRLVLRAYDDLLQRDRSLIVAIVGSLSDFELVAAYKRPALELMREALVIANENDLPSIFRAMLNNISSEIKNDVIKTIRKELSALLGAAEPSAALGVVVNEVLATALFASQAILGAFLSHIDQTQSRLTKFDVYVLLLLSASPRAAHNAKASKLITKAIKKRLLDLDLLLSICSDSRVHQSKTLTALLALAKQFLTAKSSSSSTKPFRLNVLRSDSELPPHLAAQCHYWGARILIALFDGFPSLRFDTVRILLNSISQFRLRLTSEGFEIVEIASFALLKLCQSQPVSMESALSMIEEVLFGISEFFLQDLNARFGSSIKTENVHAVELRQLATIEILSQCLSVLYAESRKPNGDAFTATSLLIFIRKHLNSPNLKLFKVALIISQHLFEVFMEEDQRAIVDAVLSVGTAASTALSRSAIISALANGPIRSIISFFATTSGHLPKELVGKVFGDFLVDLCSQSALFSHFESLALLESRFPSSADRLGSLTDLVFDDDQLANHVTSFFPTKSLKSISIANFVKERLRNPNSFDALTLGDVAEFIGHLIGVLFIFELLLANSSQLELEFLKSEYTLPLDITAADALSFDDDHNAIAAVSSLYLAVQISLLKLSVLVHSGEIPDGYSEFVSPVLRQYASVKMKLEEVVDALATSDAISLNITKMAATLLTSLNIPTASNFPSFLYSLDTILAETLSASLNNYHWLFALKEALHFITDGFLSFPHIGFPVKERVYTSAAARDIFDRFRLFFGGLSESEHGAVGAVNFVVAVIQSGAAISAFSALGPLLRKASELRKQISHHKTSGENDELAKDHKARSIIVETLLRCSAFLATFIDYLRSHRMNDHFEELLRALFEKIHTGDGVFTEEDALELIFDRLESLLADCDDHLIYFSFFQLLFSFTFGYQKQFDLARILFSSLRAVYPPSPTKLSPSLLHLVKHSITLGSGSSKFAKGLMQPYGFAVKKLLDILPPYLRVHFLNLFSAVLDEVQSAHSFDPTSTESSLFPSFFLSAFDVQFANVAEALLREIKSFRIGKSDLSEMAEDANPYQKLISYVANLETLLVITSASSSSTPTKENLYRIFLRVAASAVPILQSKVAYCIEWRTSSASAAAASEALFSLDHLAPLCSATLSFVCKLDALASILRGEVKTRSTGSSKKTQNDSWKSLLPKLFASIARFMEASKVDVEVHHIAVDVNVIHSKSAERLEAEVKKRSDKKTLGKLKKEIAKGHQAIKAIFKALKADLGWIKVEGGYENSEESDDGEDYDSDQEGFEALSQAGENDLSHSGPDVTSAPADVGGKEGESDEESSSSEVSSSEESELDEHLRQHGYDAMETAFPQDDEDGNGLESFVARSRKRKRPTNDSDDELDLLGNRNNDDDDGHTAVIDVRPKKPRLHDR